MSPGQPTSGPDGAPGDPGRSPGGKSGSGSRKGRTGPGKAGRGSARLGEVLGALLSQRRYARTLALESFRVAWSQAGGDRLEGRTRVANFRDGTLTIMVASAALRYELSAFGGADLLARLKADPAIPDVQKLVFRVGNIEA